MSSRGTVCVVAAVMLHALVARALPRAHHGSAALPLPDAPSQMVEVQQPADEDKPSAPTPRDVHAESKTPDPPAARSKPAPKTPEPTVAAPKEELSEDVGATTSGDAKEGPGDDGANGDGNAERGGAGKGGEGHDGVVGAPPSDAPSKVRFPPVAPKLQGDHDWSSCPFPPNAKRDRAFVRIQVKVAPTGDPLEVTILQDPGEGFGAAAQYCAKQHRYSAGKNEDGAAYQSVTDPFMVLFTR